MFTRSECVWLLSVGKLKKVYKNNPHIKESSEIYVI
jgi:hypothetical protein